MAIDWDSKVVSLKVYCSKCKKTTEIPFSSYDFSGGSQEMEFENHSWCLMNFKCPCGHEAQIELFGD